MKRSIALVFVFVVFTTTVSAQSSASHDVTIAVTAIDEIAISGNVTLTIDDITLSDAAAASYSVTTNGTSRKITAALDTDFSSSLTLEVTVAAPTASGSSSGAVALSTAAQDVVTGISAVAESGLAVDYSATALPSTPATTSETRTVTYTITS